MRRPAGSSFDASGVGGTGLPTDLLTPPIRLNHDLPNCWIGNFVLNYQRGDGKESALCRARHKADSLPPNTRHPFFSTQPDFDYLHRFFSVSIMIIAQTTISALIRWPGSAPRPLNFQDVCILRLAEHCAGYYHWRYAAPLPPATVSPSIAALRPHNLQPSQKVSLFLRLLKRLG